MRCAYKNQDKWSPKEILGSSSKCKEQKRKSRLSYFKKHELHEQYRKMELVGENLQEGKCMAQAETGRPNGNQ